MDERAILTRYLREQHDAVLSKVEGVAERDLRWPATATGTNLLGLVKHIASVEADYLGGCVGRPFPEELPWTADSADDNADMFATADESVDDILGLFRRVVAHGEASVAALELDAPATVPWWSEPEVTLRRLLVHLIAEIARHAGHMDIVREGIDGVRGLRAPGDNLPPGDEAWWTDYTARLRAIAEASQP